MRYVSAENVYLDGGEARGLQVGDKIEIRRNNTKIAEAEVIYVAEHSASCKLLEADRAVQVDDVALVVKRAAQPDQSPDQQPTPIPDQEPSAPQEEQTYQGPTKSSPFAKFSGSVSVQLYHWNDQNESDLDFTQPTFRVNLKARDMWGKDYQFRIRTRTRYNQRTRRYSSDVPKDEWRNRVYEVSFTYDNLNAAINYKLGRIISNHISGIGYIDGLQVQHNITPSTNIGVFVGTQPDWRTSDFQTSIQ
ncbi:MAG: hypothetical protein GWN14_19525, partial [candidate division Zixibacteria bacterium]|nr:hypothetical protein [candidate division Zixibacteria bacterium]